MLSEAGVRSGLSFSWVRTALIRSGFSGARHRQSQYAAEARRQICQALHRDFTPEERATYLRGLAPAPGLSESHPAPCSSADAAPIEPIADP